MLIRPRMIQYIDSRFLSCVAASRMPLLAVRSTAVVSDRFLIGYRSMNRIRILPLAPITLLLSIGHSAELPRELRLLRLCVDPVVSETIPEHRVLILLIHFFPIGQVHILRALVVLGGAVDAAERFVLLALLDEAVKPIVVAN